MTGPRPGAERPPLADRGLALAAAVATVVLRLPFAAHRLWDHDSVQFALAVRRFDLAAHHPHPPGYPLYVGVLDLLARLGLSPLVGMVALSILAEAAGAAALVLLVMRLGGRRPAALLAAALYVTDPLLWFYGELPLVYAVEGGLTVVLAWAAWRMADGPRPFVAACALFGLAGGVRPSTLVLLGPLLACGVLRAWRLGWRGGLERGGEAGATEERRPPAGWLTPGLVAAGLAVGGVAIALWLVPLAWLAGGLGDYRRLSAEHFGALLPETSILYGAGWPALRHNLVVLVKWSAQGSVAAALAVAAAWIVAPRRIGDGLRRVAGRGLFLAVWALPPLLFFALFHVTKAGYTLVYLPALLVAAALAAAPAMAVRRRPAALAALAVAVTVGAGLFLFGTDRRPEQARAWALVRNEFDRAEIAGYERDLDELLAVLQRFPPAETVLATVELSGSGGAGAAGFLYPYQRHLQWYAPGYEVVFLVPEQGFAEVAPGGRRDFARREGRVELPPATRRLVFVLSGPLGERLPLPPAELVLANPTFRVLALPLRGELAVGERLRLVRRRATVTVRPPAAGGAAGGPR